MSSEETDGAELTLCVFLWAHEGRESELAHYEDAVLPLLTDHGATVMQRFRPNERGGPPHEVQLLRFPSRSALDAYMADERRLVLQSERDAAIERTEVITVDVIE